MSFILDALKKSENERQQQSVGRVRERARQPPNAGPPRWLWVLGALLARQPRRRCWSAAAPGRAIASRRAPAAAAASDRRARGCQRGRLRRPARGREIVEASRRARPTARGADRHAASPTTPEQMAPAAAPPRAKQPRQAERTRSRCLPHRRVVANGTLTCRRAARRHSRLQRQSERSLRVHQHEQTPREGSARRRSRGTEHHARRRRARAFRTATFLLPRD